MVREAVWTDEALVKPVDMRVGEGIQSRDD
jgi:hypothetical protein